MRGERSADSLPAPDDTAGERAQAGSASSAPRASGEHGSTLFIAPGPKHELRSLGQDCSPIAEEPRCLGLSDDAVVMFGIDSGRYCTRPLAQALPVRSPSGYPLSLVWRQDELLLCMDDIADGPDAASSGFTMLRISLTDGTIERAGPDCLSVVSWGHDLLVFGIGVATRYADFAAFAAGKPLAASFFLPLTASASDASALYSLVDDRGGRAIWRVILTRDADWSGSHEVMQFDDAQPLASEYTSVSGLDVTTDGRLAMVREHGGAGIEVYDLHTSAQLQRFGAPFDGREFDVRGLVCEGLALP